MKLSDLTRELIARDITLWLERDQLRFSAPRGAMTAALVEAVRSHKSSLLQLLGNSLTAIAPRGARAPELSYAQERLWLVDHMEGPSGLYNEGCALLISGRLDGALLERAVRELSARHEILRSTFPAERGRPRLSIAPEPAPSLSQTHLDNLAGEQLEERLKRAMAMLSGESQRPFDLAAGPLLRMMLLRLQDDVHVLGVFVHHIVSDGLSITILCRDLVELYEAAHWRRQAILPTLRVQYADFAVWQRRYLTPERLAVDVHFWRSQLRDATAMRLAETDGEPGILKGAVHHFAIDPRLVNELDQLARQLSTTLFVVLVGCFQLLLASRSASRDIVVTSPVTERRHSELQNLIGLFVNSLVLRQTINTAWSMREYLRAVHATNSAALAHQSVPFEQILDAVGKDGGDRAAAAAMLSQARFVYLDGVVEELAIGEARAKILPVSRRLAKFDLMLTIHRGERRCAADFEYRTELFTSTGVSHLAQQYVELLECLASRHDECLNTIIEEVKKAHADWLTARRRDHDLERRRTLRSLRRRAVAE